MEAKFDNSAVNFGMSVRIILKDERTIIVFFFSCLNNCVHFREWKRHMVSSVNLEIMGMARNGQPSQDVHQLDILHTRLERSFIFSYPF